MSLTDKQIRFCKEYVVDLNATQAAIRSGYSKKTANEQASRMLANVSIQSFISKLQKKLSEKTEITAEKVIAELAKIGFSNLQDYIEQGNEITDLKQIPRNTAASVESIKKITTRWGTGKDAGEKTSVSFKLYDKVSALEKIGRHLGIFEADNKQKSSIIRVTVEDE